VRDTAGSNNIKSICHMLSSGWFPGACNLNSNVSEHTVPTSYACTYEVPTPENRPKESIWHSEHGESLKSRIKNTSLILIIIINWVVLDYMFCNVYTHITKVFQKLALKLCVPNWFCLWFLLAQIYRCKAKPITYYASWVHEWYQIHCKYRVVLNQLHFEHLVLTSVTFLYPVSFIIKKFWA
jgi:hypothetical protein